jgi:hypothetical protein
MPRTGLAAIVLFTIGAAAAGAAARPEVTVREHNGEYVVAAQFEVAAEPAAVLRVLGDYGRIPEFAPGVTRSVVRDREGNHAIVEQEAVSRMLMFSKRVHLLLDIREEGATISFRDVCGRSFASYAGAWRVDPSAAGSTIVYTLTARPAFDVPQFVVMRLLKKDAAALVDNLRREMERR